MWNGDACVAHVPSSRRGGSGVVDGGGRLRRPRSLEKKYLKGLKGTYLLWKGRRRYHHRLHLCSGAFMICQKRRSGLTYWRAPVHLALPDYSRK
jgi:hypothetical protein